MSLRTIWIIPLIVLTVFIPAPPAAAQEEETGPLRLTIEKAVELALAHNEAVQIADEGIEEARGVYTEYAADAFPQISAVASYTRYLDSPYTEMDWTSFDPLMTQMGLPSMGVSKVDIYNHHNWDFRVMLDQNLFTFGKVRNAIKLGGLYKKIAEVNKQVTVKDVEVQTRQAFLTVLFLRETVKVAQSNLDLTQETYDTISAKVAQGVQSKFELLVVEAELATAKPKVLSAQRDLNLAIQALLNVIGESLDREVEIIGELPFQPLAAELPSLVGEAKTLRPELRALELQQEMYDYSYKIYRAMYFPSLTANVTYAQSAGVDDHIWPDEPEDDFMPTFSFGVQLYIPLFDGLRSYGGMRQMEAQRKSAELQHHQASRGIELEVSSLVNNILVTEKIVQANAQAVGVAQEAHRLAELRFESGLGTRLEVSDARDKLGLARLAQAKSLYDLNTARAALDRALGK